MRQGLLHVVLLLGVLLSGCGADIAPTPQTANEPIQPQSSEETIALLQAGDFAKLDAHFSAIQRAYRRGTITDEDLRDAFRVFYDTDAPLAARYDAWIAEQPKSYVAQLARGIYFKFVGIERRGGGFARETSAAQLRGMREAHAEAAKSLYASFALDEKPLLSYLHAIDLSSVSGDEGECRRLLDLSLRADPSNFIVREKYIGTLQSRWGGSLEQMIAFRDESKQAGLSPAHLRLFEGYVVEERGWTAQYRDHDDAAALRAYREADSLGRKHCMTCFASGLASEGKYGAALEVLNEVLKEQPDDTQALGQRSDVYRELDRTEEAISDLKAGVALGDAYSQFKLGVAYMTGVRGILPKDREAAKELFRKVLEDTSASNVYAEDAQHNLAVEIYYDQHPDREPPAEEPAPSR